MLNQRQVSEVSLEEWERRKAFAGFGSEEIAVLKLLRPAAESFVKDVVELLYEQFIRFEETHRLMRDDDTLNRLKSAQHSYFLELFDGEYGEAYLLSRLNIGRVHHRIGLAPEWYMGAYAHYICLVRPHIYQALESDVEQGHKALDALTKLITLDQSLAVSTYIAAREEVIEQQTAEIMELSTPVVQVWNGVVAAPIIGVLDSQRTQRFMERLLERIVETQSPVALVDITGVPAIDTATAQHLIDTINAVRLLGSQVVITGVSPPIAQTLVHLGIDLTGISTRSSLAAGLRVALDILDLEITSRS
ncbi:MAG: protoglobin domain-containing protein [Sedimenticola sp.]